MSTVVHFPLATRSPFAGVARLVGIDPAVDGVDVGDGEFAASFGRWRVRTPLVNVTGAVVTGPYAWPKVIGPPHLSFSDRGLTFATTTDAGVCISFAAPVRGLDPFGVLRHPALTVTVDEPAALAELLTAMVEQGQGELPDEEELADHLDGMSAKELRARARELGIAGASRMARDELREALLGHRS